jgi:hypothetical protein
MLDQAEKRESDIEVPFPGMLKALIENTANTDGDHMVTRTEFAQIIQGRPKKPIQQVRDLQLCEVRMGLLQEVRKSQSSRLGICSCAR